MKDMKKYAAFGLRVGTVLLAALFLGACIMGPGDDKADGGSITISVPVSGSTMGGSSLSGSATITNSTRVRVWMYTPEGNEYRLAPTGTGIPNALNYVETTGGGQIVIDKIPAGDDYGVVVVVDEDGGSNFVPTHYAFQGSFAINAGKETELKLGLEPANGLTPGLEGVNLNSVVGVDLEIEGANPTVFASSYTRVYQQPFTDPGNDFKLADMTITTPSISAGFINSLSSTDAEDSTVLVNTDVGVFPIHNPSGGYALEKEYVRSGYGAGVRKVVSSGLFNATEGDAILYYQRLGGLGGIASASFPPEDESLTSDAWNDTGSELSDFVSPDESPVWAAVNSGTTAYMSTVMGTFRATEELFTGDDIDIDALLSGGESNTAGLTFFGVAYPGTSRPLRIRHLALVGSNVVVGTGRGAFYFPDSAITAANGGLVSNVQAIPAVRDRFIVDMSVNDGVMAILTPSQVVVGSPSTGFSAKPLRAYTLGNPRDIFVAKEAARGNRPTVFIAGSEGLSRIEL
jgi:hypothetical protein